MYERNSMCEILEKYAKNKGFGNIRCYIVTNKENNTKEYAICDNKNWLYGNSLSEAVAVHIDIMYLTEKSLYNEVESFP